MYKYYFSDKIKDPLPPPGDRGGGSTAPGGSSSHGGTNNLVTADGDQKYHKTEIFSESSAG